MYITKKSGRSDKATTQIINDRTNQSSQRYNIKHSNKNQDKLLKFSKNNSIRFCPYGFRIEHYSYFIQSNPSLTYYLLDRIYDGQINDHQIKYRSGKPEEYFVNINMKRLDKINKKLPLILKELVSVGTIESDETYCKGSKSTGYRMCARFRYIKKISMESIDKEVFLKLDKKEQEEISLGFDNIVDKMMVKMYGKIKIDNNIDYSDLSLDSNEKCLCVERSISNLNNKISKYKIDEQGRRYTTLTNSNKGLRKYIDFDGNKKNEELIEIDFSNSQFVFLVKFIREENEKSKKYNKKINAFNKKVKNPKKKKRLKKIIEDERFFDLCQDGSIYDFISEICEEDRKDVKLSLISYVLYGKKNNITEIDIKVAKAFIEEFPEVYWYIKSLTGSKSDTSQFAKSLQRLEATFVYEKVMTVICKKYNSKDGRNKNINFITVIHDAFIVNSGAVKYVKEVINREIKRFGLSVNMSEKSLKEN